MWKEDSIHCTGVVKFLTGLGFLDPNPSENNVILRSTSSIIFFVRAR